MIASAWSKFLPSGSHSLSPKPQIFLTACSTVSLGQFALIDGVSYVMGGRVGIYDTHCDQLENLTPPHPLLYPNAPLPQSCVILDVEIFDFEKFMLLDTVDI